MSRSIVLKDVPASGFPRVSGDEPAYALDDSYTVSVFPA